MKKKIILTVISIAALCACLSGCHGFLSSKKKIYTDIHAVTSLPCTVPETYTMTYVMQSLPLKNMTSLVLKKNSKDREFTGTILDNSKQTTDYSLLFVPTKYPEWYIAQVKKQEDEKAEYEISIVKINASSLAFYAPKSDIIFSRLGEYGIETEEKNKIAPLIRSITKASPAQLTQYLESLIGKSNLWLEQALVVIDTPKHNDAWYRHTGRKIAEKLAVHKAELAKTTDTSRQYALITSLYADILATVKDLRTKVRNPSYGQDNANWRAAFNTLHSVVEKTVKDAGAHKYTAYIQNYPGFRTSLETVAGLAAKAR